MAESRNGGGLKAETAASEPWETRASTLPLGRGARVGGVPKQYAQGNPDLGRSRLLPAGSKMLGHARYPRLITSNAPVMRHTAGVLILELVFIRGVRTRSGTLAAAQYATSGTYRVMRFDLRIRSKIKKQVPQHDSSKNGDT